MALPPRGDPRRPMHLAARSMMVLGCLFMVLGTCVVIPMLTGAFGGGGRMLWSSVSGVAVVFFPGAGYVVASVFLRRRQFWAVVVGLVLASVHFVLVALGVLGMAVGFATSGGGAPLPLVIFLVVWGLLLLALGQLIYHLVRSIEAIKLPPYGQESRGFEPLPVAQVVAQPGAVQLLGSGVPAGGSAAPVIGPAEAGAPQPRAYPADTEEATRPDPRHGPPPHR